MMKPEPSDPASRVPRLLPPPLIAAVALAALRLRRIEAAEEFLERVGLRASPGRAAWWRC